MKFVSIPRFAILGLFAATWCAADASLFANNSGQLLFPFLPVHLSTTPQSIITATNSSSAVNGTGPAPMQLPIATSNSSSPISNTTTTTTTTRRPAAGGYRKRRQADAEQAAKMSKVMKLLVTFKLEDCIGRAICALNCNPDGFGPDGKKVFNMMLALQTSGAISDAELKFYLNAGLAGRKLRQQQACPSCNTTYANCTASATDLIEVASLIKLDS